MGKNKFAAILTAAKTAVSKHSPEILTGMGIAGMVTTTILAVNATPKALRLIEERKNEKREPLTKVEVVKAAWKPYIPAAVTGTLSIACLIGASSVNARRNAALATAYKLSETALNEYREKVIETIGEKKNQTIREAIAKDKVENDPPSAHKEIIVTGSGDTLCYDSAFGRYFKSNMETLKRVENELNFKLLNEMYISLNEFYYEIGLDGVGAGDDLGWTVESGRTIKLEYSSQLAPDGTPCLVIGFETPPKYDYDR